MPKKPGTNLKSEFTFFNIIYEDGSQRSNRRVPSELLAGTDVDEPARKYIMQQDREIAEKSGRPTLEIIGIERVETKRKCLAIVAASMKAALEAWGASRDGFDLFPIHKEYAWQRCGPAAQTPLMGFSARVFHPVTVVESDPSDGVVELTAGGGHQGIASPPAERELPG